MTITWQQSPEGLGEAMLAYVGRLEVAATRAAQRLAAILEAEAKPGAPWTDRTGDARRELFSAVDVAGTIITVYLSHGQSITYGVFLETLRAGKHAIILPTIERHMDEIWALLREEIGQ